MFNDYCCEIGDERTDCTRPPKRKSDDGNRAASGPARASHGDIVRRLPQAVPTTNASSSASSAAPHLTDTASTFSQYVKSTYPPNSARPLPPSFSDGSANASIPPPVPGDGHSNPPPTSDHLQYPIPDVHIHEQQAGDVLRSRPPAHGGTPPSEQASSPGSLRYPQNAVMSELTSQAAEPSPSARSLPWIGTVIEGGPRQPQMTSTSFPVHHEQIMFAQNQTSEINPALADTPTSDSYRPVNTDLALFSPSQTSALNPESLPGPMPHSPLRPRARIQTSSRPEFPPRRYGLHDCRGPFSRPLSNSDRGPAVGYPGGYANTILHRSLRYLLAEDLCGRSSGFAGYFPRTTAAAECSDFIQRAFSIWRHALSSLHG